MQNPQKKDKEEILDEVWTEARVRSFLELQAPEGFDADFHRLLKAYQSMRIENFQQFVDFFKTAGGNFKATSPEGETVLQIVQQHRRSGDYAEALLKAGA